MAWGNGTSERPAAERRATDWKAIVGMVGVTLGVAATSAGAVWWAVAPRFVAAADYQHDVQKRADEGKDLARELGSLNTKVEGLSTEVQGIRTGIKADLSEFVRTMDRRRGR